MPLPSSPLSHIAKQVGQKVYVTNAADISGGGSSGGLTDTQLRASAVPVSNAAGATSAKQDTGNTSLGTIATAVAAATPAGTNLIGKVGIDQTTPGTTNAVSIQTAKGAASIASAQAAASTSAATLVASRATRRSVTIKNIDPAITVYVGPATVTSGNGMQLKAGESISIDWVGLVQVIAASGTPTVAYMETYD